MGPYAGALQPLRQTRCLVPRHPRDPARGDALSQSSAADRAAQFPPDPPIPTPDVVRRCSAAERRAAATCLGSNLRRLPELFGSSAAGTACLEPALPALQRRISRRLGGLGLVCVRGRGEDCRGACGSGPSHTTLDVPGRTLEACVASKCLQSARTTCKMRYIARAGTREQLLPRSAWFLPGTVVD